MKTKFTFPNNQICFFKNLSGPGLHWFLPNCDNFATRCPVSGPWLIRPPGCPLPPGLRGLRSKNQLHTPGAWCAWSQETILGAENFFQDSNHMQIEKHHIEKNVSVKKMHLCFLILDQKLEGFWILKKTWKPSKNIQSTTTPKNVFNTCVSVCVCAYVRIYFYTFTSTYLYICKHIYLCPCSV